MLLNNSELKQSTFLSTWGGRGGGHLKVSTTNFDVILHHGARVRKQTTFSHLLKITTN